MMTRADRIGIGIDHHGTIVTSEQPWGSMG
jgi:hypothetical protein